MTDSQAANPPFLSKELHVYFSDEEVLKDGRAYCVFPGLSLKDLTSNVISKSRENNGFNPLDLKKSLLAQLEAQSSQFPELYESINNLYFWHFLPLFVNLGQIIDHIESNAIVRVFVYGNHEPAYSAAFFNGAEGSPRFLYRPELYLSQMIALALSERVEVVRVFKHRTWVFDRAVALIRPILIGAIKSLLSVLMAVKVRMGTDLPRDDGSDLDLLFIARSAALNNISSLLQAMLTRGIRVGLFYDPTLYQLKNPTKALETVPPGVKVVYAPRYSSILHPVKLLLKRLFSLPKRGVSVDLSCGKVLLSQNLDSLAKELRFGLIDRDLHGARLAEYLTKNRVKTVLSTELVSPYIFQQAAVTKQSGSRFFTIQALTCAPEEFIRCVVGDGMVVKTQEFRDGVIAQDEQAQGKVHCFGDIDYIGEAKKSVVENGLKITFFSQPYDLLDQLAIVRDICSVRQTFGSRIDIRVKLHPRDSGLWISKDLDVQILDSADTVRDLILDSDLVISRTSSIMDTALICGVPYLACTFTEHDRQWNLPYLDDQLGVKVNCNAELVSRLQAIDHYFEEFARRRADFLRGKAKEFDMSGLLVQVLN